MGKFLDVRRLRDFGVVKVVFDKERSRLKEFQLESWYIFVGKKLIE